MEVLILHLILLLLKELALFILKLIIGPLSELISLSWQSLRLKWCMVMIYMLELALIYSLILVVVRHMMFNLQIMRHPPSNWSFMFWLFLFAFLSLGFLIFLRTAHRRNSWSLSSILFFVIVAITLLWLFTIAACLFLLLCCFLWLLLFFICNLLFTFWLWVGFTAGLVFLGFLLFLSLLWLQVGLELLEYFFVMFQETTKQHL